MFDLKRSPAAKYCTLKSRTIQADMVPFPDPGAPLMTRRRRFCKAAIDVVDPRSADPCRPPAGGSPQIKQFALVPIHFLWHCRMLSQRKLIQLLNAFQSSLNYHIVWM